MSQTVRKTTINALIPIIFSLVFLVSCNQSGIGIFYSLEIEESVESSVLGNYITPLSAAYFGDSYYIAVKSLYASNDAMSWEEASLSGSADDYPYVLELSVFNSYLYGLFYAEGDYDQEEDPSIVLLRSADGSAFTEAATFSGSPVHLFVENGILFVCLSSDSTYSMVYSTDGTTFTSVSLETLSQPVFDSAYDGANYWFVTESAVYRGTSPASLSKESSFEVRHVGGIVYSGINNAVFVSGSQSGQIYYYNGTSWIGSEVVEDSGSDEIEFMDMIEYTISGTTYLLIGTIENGYYEVSLTGDPLAASFTVAEPEETTTDNNYYNVGLSSYSIRTFFPVGTDDLLALSLGNGLWINNDDDGDRTWSRS